jgi:hypothetical protein
MPLAEDVRELADRVVGRLDESLDFYLHTRQAWRVVQQLAHEGHAVGIVDASTGAEVPAGDLEALAQRYVTIHLAESVFRTLAGQLEDWVCGLARIWLKAYPRQLDSATHEAADRPRAQRRDALQIPLSEILAAPDIATVLADVVERVVRDLAYRRPDQWFRFLENRVNLGCPDAAQRAALCELKAARDVLEHNRGVIGADYLDKAGPAARYALDALLQVDEPYLLDSFALLRNVVEAMAQAAIRRASGRDGRTGDPAGASAGEDAGAGPA